MGNLVPRLDWCLAPRRAPLHHPRRYRMGGARALAPLHNDFVIFNFPRRLERSNRLLSLACSSG